MSGVRIDEGYDEVFRAEHGSIVRTAFLVTGDRETAREVAQEAFAELYVRWAKVRTYDRPGAWGRRGAPDLRGTGGATGGAEDVGLDVLASLQELSPAQRAAVVLHYFDDLPVA